MDKRKRDNHFVYQMDSCYAYHDSLIIIYERLRNGNVSYGLYCVNHIVQKGV
jgi:hypothetical protein